MIEGHSCRSRYTAPLETFRAFRGVERSAELCRAVRRQVAPVDLLVHTAPPSFSVVAPPLDRVSSMTDEWTWTYLDADGQPMSGETLVLSGFPSQSDAESWLGEQWRALAAVGVDSVTLAHEGSVVYGPMSLRAAE